MAEADDSRSSPDLATLSFEEAFACLGQMMESLEQGGLPLAEATELYQQGMQLVQRCNELLNEAQLKITQLRDSQAVPGDGIDWEKEIFEE